MTQSQWQWCTKCQELTFAGSGTLGLCPAGGNHTHTGSADYSLAVDDPSVGGQDNWRWCRKCQALTFGGGASLGACPHPPGFPPSEHDHGGSGNYRLGAGAPQVGAQSEWRWCNKCQALTFTGGSTVGQCAAGGSHDHAGSSNYRLWLSVPPDGQPVPLTADGYFSEVVGVTRITVTGWGLRPGDTLFVYYAGKPIRDGYQRVGSAVVAADSSFTFEDAEVHYSSQDPADKAAHVVVGLESPDGFVLGLGSILGTYFVPEVPIIPV